MKVFKLDRNMSEVKDNSKLMFSVMKGEEADVTASRNNNTVKKPSRAGWRG
jgi:hypothetical protein